MSKLNTIPKRLQVAQINRNTMTTATDRIRGYTLKKINDRIALRDLYTCRMCGVETMEYEIDHIIPLHLGGKEIDDNRQLLCIPCHKVKTEGEEQARRG